jgi:hypothetical protein
MRHFGKLAEALWKIYQEHKLMVENLSFYGNICWKGVLLEKSHGYIWNYAYRWGHSYIQQSWRSSDLLLFKGLIKSSNL